jgi:DnaJ-class molecular chaperone
MFSACRAGRRKMRFITPTGDWQNRHPDLNPGDKQAEERFKKIVNAYDLISSAEKGILLDQAGFDNGDSAEPFSATASYTADATFTTRRCSDGD